MWRLYYRFYRRYPRRLPHDLFDILVIIGAFYLFALAFSLLASPPGGGYDDHTIHIIIRLAH